MRSSGFGQLLEMSELDDRQRRNIGQILRGGSHLLTLIDEVLQISRIESGRTQLSLGPVDVGQLAAEVIELISPSAQAAGVELAAVRGDGGLWARADLQSLKQVLLNLLSNAIKYNHRRGRVDVRVQLDPAGRVAISVADTGLGIAADMIDRLFTPFDRLGAERSRIEGTGLGLSLSKRFIDAMNATIEVDSEPGRGTTFTVSLQRAARPALEHARWAPDGAAVPVSPDDRSRATGRPSRILYIEDNPSNRELLETVFASRPELTLMSAVQGSTGIRLAREHSPDLVLLDLHLPDIPGIEVLRRLREDPVTREMPVVVVSADATQAQINRLLGAGARAYLTKPIDVALLWRTIDEALDRPAAAA